VVPEGVVERWLAGFPIGVELLAEVLELNAVEVGIFLMKGLDVSGGLVG